MRILPDRLCRNQRLQPRPGRPRLPRHHGQRSRHYHSLLRLSALCPREAVQRERRAKAGETPPARHGWRLLHPSLPILVRLERTAQYPLDHANHRLRLLFRRRFPALQFCPQLPLRRLSGLCCLSICRQRLHAQLLRRGVPALYVCDVQKSGRELGE